MKKLMLLPALLMLCMSCEFMLKDRDTSNAEVKPEEKIVLGNDKDAKGCVTSAGYKWSLLRKECIRVFEEGYRLNAIDSLKAENSAASAFVVFDKEEKDAELYLPATEKSILLKKQSEGIYKAGIWTLQTSKGYSLKRQGRMVYAGAAIQENKIIGDDQQESVNVPAPVVIKDSTTVAE